MGEGIETQKVQPDIQVDDDDFPASQWSLATRVAFRFCFLYFGLFCLASQIFEGLFAIPGVDLPDPGSIWPLHPITQWVAIHLFRITRQLVYTGSGSGDKTVDWVLAFCLLVVAIMTTTTWTILDRRRKNYRTLHKWFRLFIRLCLAGQMFSYGLTKVIPLQMPFPYLTQLIEPFGHMTSMAILWASIGASPGYEVFAGCAETVAGLLLIIPRLTTLGALLCFLDMVQVFMLNMTYDVPVKLFSFHLLLMSLFLLAPESRRLANLFILNRAAAPSSEVELFTSTRANRIALVTQVLFGLLLAVATTHQSLMGWHQYGGASPKSPLYGIWEVDQFSSDGQVVQPLLTNHQRWRRVVFDSPTSGIFQRIDDSIVYYNAAVNEQQSILWLTESWDATWKANLTYQRPDPGHLVLDGEMDGHKLHVHLVAATGFRFRGKDFHWIQEYPVIR